MGDSDEEARNNFLQDALVLLKQKDQKMNDLLPFIARYHQMIQWFSAVDLTEDAIDGPMNSVAGFMTVIQIAYQKLNLGRGVKTLKTYKEESLDAQDDPVPMFVINVVAIDNLGLQNSVLLSFDSLDGAKNALEVFDGLDDLDGLPAAYRRYLLLDACYKVVFYTGKIKSHDNIFVRMVLELKVKKYESHYDSVVKVENFVGNVMCCCDYDRDE